MNSTQTNFFSHTKDLAQSKIDEEISLIFPVSVYQTREELSSKKENKIRSMFKPYDDKCKKDFKTEDQENIKNNSSFSKRLINNLEEKDNINEKIMEEEESDDQNEKIFKNKIFIGGIPSSLSLKEQQDHFKKFGNIIDIKIAKIKKTAVARGFAFITFEKNKSASAALETDHYFGNRLIECRMSFKKQFAKEMALEETKKKIFVSGFTAEVTEKQLTEFFSTYGVVKSLYIICEWKTNISKRMGYVTFEDTNISLRVVNLKIVKIFDSYCHLYPSSNKTSIQAMINKMKQDSKYNECALLHILQEPMKYKNNQKPSQYQMYDAQSSQAFQKKKFGNSNAELAQNQNYFVPGNQYQTQGNLSNCVYQPNGTQMVVQPQQMFYQQVMTDHNPIAENNNLYYYDPNYYQEVNQEYMEEVQYDSTYQDCLNESFQNDYSMNYIGDLDYQKSDENQSFYQDNNQEIYQNLDNERNHQICYDPHYYEVSSLVQTEYVQNENSPQMYQQYNENTCFYQNSYQGMTEDDIYYQY